MIRDSDGRRDKDGLSHPHFESCEVDDSWSLYLDCEFCVQGFDSHQDLELHVKAHK